MQSGTDGFSSTVAGVGSGDGSADEIMLFGVRVKVDPMRKSVSMNDLSQYEQPHESSNAVDVPAVGYVSADEAVHHQSSGSRERKRGVPWTEEEHKLFLLGLQKVGKGDWRGISRNFVKTRTPTQVASHAQKYFLRRSNLNRRRRRTSLFDITTESVAATPMEEENVDPETKTASQPPLPESLNASRYQVLPLPINNSLKKLSLQPKLTRPTPVLPVASNPPTMLDLNVTPTWVSDTLPLSLNLSLSSDDTHFPRHSAFQVMLSFSNGDSSNSNGISVS